METVVTNASNAEPPQATRNSMAIATIAASTVTKKGIVTVKKGIWTIIENMDSADSEGINGTEGIEVVDVQITHKSMMRIFYMLKQTIYKFKV